MKKIIIAIVAIFISQLVIAKDMKNNTEIAYASDRDANKKMCEKLLFKIEKSDNANVLYYDAKVDNGHLSDNVVDIYWLMHAEKGQKEKMTMLEKPQFDINSKVIEKGKHYVVNVKNSQLSDKDINIKLDEDGCPYASVDINGETAELKDIHIRLGSKKSFLPTVLYIEIKGVDEQGNEISERINTK